MTVLIPKGFTRIACTELNTGVTECYYNRERSLFYVVITDPVEDTTVCLGPFPKRNLASLMVTLGDAMTGC